VSLARAASEKPLPQNLTPRQAILAFVGDHRIPAFYNDWEQWCLGQRARVEEEAVADFGGTP
jgi:hypothetical protein